LELETSCEGYQEASMISSLSLRRVQLVLSRVCENGTRDGGAASESHCSVGLCNSTLERHGQSPVERHHRHNFHDEGSSYRQVPRIVYNNDKTTTSTFLSLGHDFVTSRVLSQCYLLGILRKVSLLVSLSAGRSGVGIDIARAIGLCTLPWIAVSSGERVRSSASKYLHPRSA
jgi:hypothetical protein